LALVSAGAWGGALFTLWVLRYPYGSYKVILVAWWAICWCVLAGAEGLSRRLGLPRAPALGAFATLLLVAYALVCPAARRVHSAQRERGLSLADFRTVEAVKGIVADSGIALRVDAPAANQWALYFLRDVPLRVLEYRGYMALPGRSALMARAAAPEWSRVGYLLTDGPFVPKHEAQAESLVWSSAAYQLWRLKPGVALLDVANPSGVEQVGGQTFFWLGGKETRLTLLAQRPGCGRLRAVFVPGPAAQRAPTPRLEVLVGGSPQYTVALRRERRSLPVPLKPGLNLVVLRTLDTPTPWLTPHGLSGRPLILGVHGLRVSLAGAVAGCRSPSYLGDWSSAATLRRRQPPTTARRAGRRAGL
jgi:hypothetical protein